ncbi:MAG: BREX-1 system phosphatase PglZ type B [Chloroflexi bacterium]|nr:BREX-1 system phosphatase PglZ type B [Chloroflexota bacterium]
MNTAERRGRGPAVGAVLDRLLASLRAKAAPLDGETRPAAVLWTDPREEWRPLVDLLLQNVDECVVLGDYAPARRTGPAVWVRCVVDGTLDEPALPDSRPPIVYLPGVARQDLRAGGDCPDGLRPLVELLFRGALWRQPNGSDWTVNAFLTSRKALGLDVAGDRATAEALLRALPEVALAPVAQLEGRRLEAEDFDRMLAGDVIRDLLRWMGDPETTRARLGENGWHAFCSRCQNELGFSPAQEADVVAGERMARGEEGWAAVWERFAEAPGSYGDIPGLLRRSAPAGALRFEERERWPDLNDEDEQAVRGALEELPKLAHDEACEAVTALERSHGERRAWVWARLGLAPMAELLKPLASLAAAARQVLGGTEPADVASAYVERGWQADLGAWQAVAAAPVSDEGCVASAVRHLLQPWLEESARAFQEAGERKPLPGAGEQPPVNAEDEGCLVFVDGLRFDLAQRLAERLEGRGLRVDPGRRWAALPTVTGTGKPAVTPVAGEFEGDALVQAFGPRLKAAGKPADAPALRDAMAVRGYQILAGDGSDAPRAHPAHGWLETGEFDTLGHQRGAQLARHLEDELERVAERIERVLDAGWTSVRVVTDHGWLLLPGGLPKVDLPKHLTESRWARCAAIAGESTPDVVRAPWHWNGAQWFATPPGIACFNRSEEYAHGGLSIQECLIPDLVVTRVEGAETAGSITSVTWRGLRCFVEAEVRGGPVTADLRLARPTGESVAAAAKPVDADGAVSLVLADDEHEAAALVLVLLDDADRVLAHRLVRVGEDA